MKDKNKNILLWPHFVMNGILLLFFVFFMSSCAQVTKLSKSERQTRQLQNVQLESLKEDLDELLGRTEDLSAYRMRSVTVSLKEL